jgi:hypothetical protein
MGYILFNNKKKPVEAQAKKLNRNQIEITGCEINTSGFSYYQDAEMKRKYGDFNDFKTLYREMDESYILSNNGSVYPVEPEPEPQEQPVREMVEEISEELTNTQIAMCENYEQGVILAEELTNTQMAVTELYEMMLGGI